MDPPNSRNAINDPNQCRLCMRVCEDSFLECIFSDKEYSIAHQIFECTSIRVTKQDNLTKICKNCASLLFMTTEFRNACFKTNRLLMEDFVILELGDWASEGNQLLLRECESFIVRHKQQVDYLYASIVTDHEQYLEGPLEIETELFEQRPLQQQHIQLPVERKLASDTISFPPDVAHSRGEPDPEILMDITKFLEEQTPANQASQTDRMRCGLCCRTVSGSVFELTSTQLEILRVQKIDGTECNPMRTCEACSLLLDVLDSFRATVETAQSVPQSECSTRDDESMIELEKTLLEKLKQKQATYIQPQSERATITPQPNHGVSSKKDSPAETGHQHKKSYKRSKVACHICGKQYDSWKLQTHLNEHENIRPYACDQAGCGSTFTGLVLLNRHKKLWHTDYFYATCGVCGKKCKTQGIYKTHLSYHEEPKLPCTVCGKLMRNKRAIWKHMKTHSNDRKHVCGVCNKRFTIAYTLRVHMRIHTNDKPYPCVKCDKRFQYKCLLKNHQQKYHSEDSAT
uniref:Protein krueppel n=1 Tax=Anopheles farauti TaxID=69004 RepID=A0A182Q7Y1_9DIPT